MFSNKMRNLYLFLFLIILFLFFYFILNRFNDMLFK